MGKKIRLERDVYQEPGRVFSVTIPASTPVFANRSLAGAVWSVTMGGNVTLGRGHSPSPTF